jgi:hypothetical protein
MPMIRSSPTSSPRSITFFDLPAQIGSAMHRLAQDVPGRNLGNPVLASETFRLRALARARRAKHHQVQRHVSRAVP